MAEGAVESHVVLLLDAIAKVTVMMSDGRQALLSVRVSGDIVGETSALNDTPRSATVTTCRPSIIRIIHRAAFRSFLGDHPNGAIEIAGIIADRLRWANTRRVDFASYPLNVRLARILCEMARACGRRTPSGIVVGIGLTQPELATLCGAADVSLQKAARELRHAGIVSTGYREITILDPEALQQIADLAPPDSGSRRGQSGR
ncbi:MAG: Crp/Fnr family transcriptional regulator [Micromonosporaceae bacterium]|nr:Crp/Fnr family transcriptional regulator [Micromonosporaceae bacterium]